MDMSLINENTTVGTAANMGYFLMNNDTLYRLAAICICVGAIIMLLSTVAFSMTSEYIRERRARK